MKLSFLVLALLVVAALTQNVKFQPNRQPTINIKDDDRLDEKKEIVVDTTVQNHPLLGKQEFNGPVNAPFLLGREQFNNDGFGDHPLLGKQQFNTAPLLGQQEFNMPPPPPRHGQRRRQQEHRGPRHGQWRGPRPQGDPFMNNQKHGKPGHFQKMQEGQMNMMPNNQEFDPRMPHPDDRMMNPQEWHGHMKGPRGHKRMKCAIITTAIVFTLVGVCLAKCCRKCKKNPKKQVRQMIRRTKTASQIHDEIVAEQKRLEELKSQYAIKRSQQQNRVNHNQQMMQRQAQMNQPRPYFVQPYPVYYEPTANIPMGRPVNNQSTRNASYATEYPTL